MQSLRDALLVPLLTGNLGAQMVVDHFWTPAINWTSLFMLLGAMVAALIAAAAWYRGQPSPGGSRTLPMPATWIGLFIGAMIFLGVAVGVGVALSR